MNSLQQPEPSHQSATFGSGQTQFFECEALGVDHPEIQARESARQQQEQSHSTEKKLARPARDRQAEE